MKAFMMTSGHEGVHDDFGLSKLRLKAVLRGNDLIDTMSYKNFVTKTIDRALADVLLSINHNALTTMQDGGTAIQTWEKLISRFKRKCSINRLILLEIYLF